MTYILEELVTIGMFEVKERSLGSWFFLFVFFFGGGGGSLYSKLYAIR